MNLKTGGIRLRVHPSFIAYLAVLSIADSIALAACLLVSLLLHESAHLLVGYALDESFERIDITPFGGIITYSSSHSSKGLKCILIALSGPAANYIAILVLSLVQAESLFDLQRLLISINASMLVLNLLPVLPLDGGRIVFSIGYYLFPISALVSVLGYLGGITGALFILIALYGYVMIGKLNISLFIVGVYVLTHIRRESTALLMHNQYTVLHERMSRNRDNMPVKILYTRLDAPLVSLLPDMKNRKYLLCLTHVNDRIIMIGEDEVCKTIMERPSATVIDAIRHHKTTASLETF